MWADVGYLSSNNGGLSAVRMGISASERTK
jgi:hypothetical protein